MPLSKKTCRHCEYNDYIRVGVDYCVRGACKYKKGVGKDVGKSTQGKAYCETG